MKAEIRVPATSANIGAGFDSLGLAVQLYNRVILEPWDRVEVVSLDGTAGRCRGCGSSRKMPSPWPGAWGAAPPVLWRALWGATP